MCIYSIVLVVAYNTWRPEQNGCYFADNILQYISLKENICIFIQISLKFAPKGPICQ